MNRKILIAIGVVLISCTMAVGTWAYMQANEGLSNVYIWYFNTRTNSLESERRMAPYEDRVKMIQAVIRLLYSPSSSDLQRIIPEDLFIDRVNLYGRDMVIHFTARYHDLAPHEEALVRASIVYTMIDLPFIDSVQILVDGEDLLDPFGEPLGKMDRGRVRVNPPIRPHHKVLQTFTLYFVSSDMSGLLAEERTTDVDFNLPTELFILRQLIYGSTLEGRISSIPPSTRILDVRTEGGICSINLSQEFIDNFNGSQTLAELTLHSIVHSIMENVGSVNSIQFFIDSQLREQFNGVPYFDTLFVN
ncbi:MAG: GerMN domain-containing protein [Defluviitaleaceae bacterium]|nr:GerMN domain-containing protein [Defluviitaleaceae bacterium]